MQNGTCATITELWNASEDALSVNKLRESLQKAPQLDVEDIKLSEEERKLESGLQEAKDSIRQNQQVCMPASISLSIY